MEDLYESRQVQDRAVILIKTPSLMNGREVDWLRDDLTRLVSEQKPSRLVIDFTNVQYLSSQVLGMLVNLHKKMPGGGLILCGVSPSLLQLLKIACLDRLLKIKPTQKEALQP